MSSYFNHPYAMRNTPEILELRACLGFQSYAIYLMLLESIAESDTQSINQKLLNGVSISYGCDIIFLKSVIDKCVELDLFFIQNDFIFSNHLAEHFEKRSEIKEKRALAGASGGLANSSKAQANSSKAQANVKQMLSKTQANAKQNVPKESKVKKESKEIYIDSFELSENFKKAFDDWIEFRKKIKKPLTGKAIELGISKLKSLHTEEYLQIQAINQSIEHGWTTFYTVKNPQPEIKLQSKKQDLPIDPETGLPPIDRWDDWSNEQQDEYFTRQQNTSKQLFESKTNL